MDRIFLHHYDESPFSEKVRLALGIKGLRWHSVEIPQVMPKPAYTALTGGYRKTPALQIGAEVWCDSAAILRELERRLPTPTLFPGGGEGLQWALAGWSDRAFFQAAVAVIFGSRGDRVPAAFVADRAQMTGTAFDVARMRAAIPVMSEQLRAHAWLVESQLADGRPFLTGDAPALADLQAYFVPWFLRRTLAEAAAQLDRLPRMRAWHARVGAIGHGDRQPADAAEALAVARASTPTTLPEADPNEPNGLKPGELVEVAPDDYGRDFVRGELLASGPHEIAILRRTPDLGEVVVHFPRLGFVVARSPHR